MWWLNSSYLCAVHDKCFILKSGLQIKSHSEGKNRLISQKLTTKAQYVYRGQILQKREIKGGEKGVFSPINAIYSDHWFLLRIRVSVYVCLSSHTECKSVPLNTLTQEWGMDGLSSVVVFHLPDSMASDRGL